MSSASSEPPLFYDDAVATPQFRESPGEWRPGWLVLPEDLGDWRNVQAWVQDTEVSVSLRVIDGKARVVVPWDRANPGRHRIVARGPERRWDTCVEIEPETISREAFAALLGELAHKLPASIALSLRRAGANLPLEITDPDRATPAEEFERLRWCVDGWPDDSPGLKAILRSIGQAPVMRLVREAEFRPIERALRPDLTRLGPLLATLPLDSKGRPRRILDMRPVESLDTPENRFVAHFARLVSRRLRRLGLLAETLEALDGKAIDDLVHQTRRAVRKIPELVELPSRTVPPESQAMLRLAPYRQALGLWLRFRKSLTATLEDRRLDAPSENVPSLYELWGTLSVILGTLDALRDAVWEVEHQEIVGETSYGLAVRTLAGGWSAVTARSPDRRFRLEVVPQASATPSGRSLTSVSYNMRPDVAVLFWEEDRLDSVLLFDPKYKRAGQAPVNEDIKAMHAYRDGIRDSHGRRVVTYAAIIYPGDDVDYSGQVGAIRAVPGIASPSETVRKKVAETILRLDDHQERPGGLGGTSEMR